MDAAYETYKTSLQKEIDKSISSLEQAKARQISDSAANLRLKNWQASVDEIAREKLAIDRVSKGFVRPAKNIRLDWRPDYALSVFEYAKEQKRVPNLIAEDVSQVFKDAASIFNRVETAGPYINLQVADSVLMESVKDIINQGTHYGRTYIHAGQARLVEYSAPNVAKPFGVNHLRSTVIGETLARLFEATGYAVVRDNHLGDWGTQFGNLLAAYEEYASDRPFESLTVDELTALYVRFSQEKKESPRLVRLGQQCFLRLEEGDPVLRERWAIALERSMEEFSAMYKRLGVHFDTQIGEAYYIERSQSILDDLAVNHASKSLVFDTQTKAVYINGEHPVVVRTQDGYGVYAARDIATIQFRQETYPLEGITYVVGEEQATYFRSVFMVAEEIGLTKNKLGEHIDLEHIGFGLLLDPSGKKLSTRKGTSGKLEDVLNALAERALEETKKRNPDMSDSDAQVIAEKVAIGALIWNDLRTDHNANVKFDIGQMLQLGGGSVIDVLYTYSRTCSILNKLGIKDSSQIVQAFPEKFSTDIEHELALMLSQLGGIIQKAAESRGPHILAHYIHELTQLHGRFYEESRVIDIEDAALANARIALHWVYKIVIENSLSLLNIPFVEHL